MSVERAVTALLDDAMHHAGRIALRCASMVQQQDCVHANQAETGGLVQALYSYLYIYAAS
eukprot:scaffold630976_cov17-Prasinocladus_malaysianus.AAC.1